jgi:hypothetical protein
MFSDGYDTAYLNDVTSKYKNITEDIAAIHIS